MNLLKKFFQKIFDFFKKEEEIIVPGIKFGWKKDAPDERDFKFKIDIPHELPPLIDLRPLCPPVYNQGDLGSCSANATCAAFQFEQMKQKITNWNPSRLFTYYNTRALEGTINTDAGATLRNAVKTLVDNGACPETMWPYKPCKFKKKPDDVCYTEGLKNQVTEYLRLTPHTLYEVKHCLADGFPVIFGFMVYESLMSDNVARTGMAPMPGANEQSMGGHAVLAVGYDDSKQCLIVRNSWGENWGLKGYFYMPYGFVTTPNLSADYWTIRMVE